MRNSSIALVFTGAVFATSAWAAAPASVSYLKCEVQTTFHKPTFHGSEWTHVENTYTKYLKLDSAAKMVWVFDDRRNVYKPICGANNSACANQWGSGSITLDGTHAPAEDAMTHIDFRRSLALTNQLGTVKLVIADYGDSKDGNANMSWSYEGQCAPSAEPKAMARPGPGAGAVRPPSNPNYEVAKGPALPISDAERDQVLAGYNHNTMWGYSGGGHWLHMWFFDKGLAYTSDDYDISSEAKTRQWYFGKDSTGYRICGAPIPAQGLSGCYPFPKHNVGDTWVQHDMDGDPDFTLLPGRQ